MCVPSSVPQDWTASVLTGRSSVLFHIGQNRRTCKQNLKATQRKTTTLSLAVLVGGRYKICAQAKSMYKLIRSLSDRKNSKTMSQPQLDYISQDR